uniref:AI-2E family transporter n=1 Tax=Rhodopseudomonas palustris (strain BisA53) TaxID=316055 RepID=Q07TI5_RHOP5
MHAYESKFFLLLIAAVTLAFGWVLMPFYSGLLWGLVIAILFMPLHRRLSAAMRDRDSLAAVSTVAIVIMSVLLPLSLIGAALAREAAITYSRLQSREFDLARLWQQVTGALPSWINDWINRVELADLGELQNKLSDGLLKGSQFLAGQALTIGQNTFEFAINLGVMLYLLFFLFRDGEALSQRIRDALPMREHLFDELLTKFIVVIRATIKGNMVIAMLQGALGGLMLWFLGIGGALLWAVVMAFLSLLPAIGAGLVWLPVAIYLLATGAVWKGVLLIAYGTFVIGMVDNLLRPILVGKDTKMPDYVVLISTLGGLEVFGLNGFILGPVIAAMFIAVWDIFASSRHIPAREREAA